MRKAFFAAFDAIHRDMDSNFTLTQRTAYERLFDRLEEWRRLTPEEQKAQAFLVIRRQWAQFIAALEAQDEGTY